MSSIEANIITLSDDTQLAKRQRDIAEIISLFTIAEQKKVIASGKVDDIRTLLDDLCNQLEIDFEKVYNYELQKSATTSPGAGGQADPKGQEKQKTAKKPTNRNRSKQSSQRSSASKTAKQLDYSLKEQADLSLTQQNRIELNAQAIELLQSAKTTYSDKEKKTLSLYTGQGGLSAQDVGSLNQHYTRYSLTRFMWKAMQKLGLKGGYVLDPGCGVGNFAGNKPDGVNMVMFDNDSIAANIASALYPNDIVLQSDVKNFAFEEYDYLVGAIGNPPFGDYRRYKKTDPFARLKPRIHDYFILKMLETVQPGGLVAVVSSMGTMDKKNFEIRQEMIGMAHFLGAFRLPASTFEANANTSVVTDVMFFQKRADDYNLSRLDSLFIATDRFDAQNGPADGVNSFYCENPSMVLGNFIAHGGNYNRHNVTGSINEDTFLDVYDRYFKGGIITAHENVPDPIRPKKAQITKKVVLSNEILSCEKIIYALKDLIRAQKESSSKKLKDELRSTLKALVNKHLKKYSHFTKSRLVADYYDGKPDYYQLINIVEPDGKTFAQIIDRDTIFNAQFAPKAKSKDPHDVVLYFRQTGRKSSFDELVDFYAPMPQAAVKKLLSDSDRVYYNPETQAYELAYEYLAGNIRTKIEIAESYAPENVDALKKVLPELVSADKITFDLRDINSWMPPEIAQEYINFSIQGTLQGIQRNWTIINMSASLDRSESFGWRRSYAAILEDYLNGRNYPKQSVPTSASDAVKEKANSDKAVNNNKMNRIISKRFNEWLKEIAEPELLEKSVELWNKNYNSVIEPSFTGETIAFKGVGSTWLNGKPFKFRSHQLAFIEKAIYKGSMVNAHGVGAGKTLEIIGTAQSLKDTGAAQKPLIAVPSKVIEKCIAEHLAAFPGANILNLRTSKKERAKLLARAQMNQYDAIYITHEGLASLNVSEDVKADYIRERIEEIEDEISKLSAQMSSAAVQNAISSASGNKGVKLRTKTERLLKNMQLSKLRLEQKLSESIGSDESELIYFDELGVDAILIDEAHNFKNVFLSARAAELGIGVSTGSSRGEEAALKIDYINKKMGYKNIFLFTATPTNNTPLEAYLFLRWVAAPYLKQMGIYHVDTFIDEFANIEIIDSINSLNEPTTKTIVTGYKKLDILRKIFYEYVEYIDTGDFADVFRPDLKEEPVIIQPNSLSKGIRNHLELRSSDIASGNPLQYTNKAGEPRQDTYLYIVTSGSRAAIDGSMYIQEELMLPMGDSAKMLYQVELDFDTPDMDTLFLDWRGYQSPGLLKKIISGINSSQMNSWYDANKGILSTEQHKRLAKLRAITANDTIKGEDLYNDLTYLFEGQGFIARNGTNGKFASQYLDQWGVLGVWFAAQNGASSAKNFVLFNDKNAKITKKLRINHAVYHGTKTDFDSFSTQYIGAGEGQHVYGWGLYFTESQAVAKWYAESVSQRGSLTKIETGKIEKDSKADLMISRLVENHWTTPKDVEDKLGELHQNVLNGQLIFCDAVTTVSGANFHHRLRDEMIDRSIAPDDIAIINGQENNKPDQKKKIQDAYNSGKIRIIIGNTSSMGEGMDLNRFTSDIHHLDVPWKPSDLIQRNGRGHRQGNVMSNVNAWYYLTAQSMDTYRYQILTIKQQWIDQLWKSDITELDEVDSESSYDYETVMKSLLDDPEKIEALDLSGQIKKAVRLYDNAEDDNVSAANALHQIQMSQNSSYSNVVGFYERVTSIASPDPDVKNFEQAVENGYLVERPTGHWANFNLDGQYFTYCDVYKISDVSQMEMNILIATRQHDNKFYGHLNRGEATFTTKAASLKELHAKIWNSLSNFVNNFDKKRKSALNRKLRDKQVIQLYKMKLIQSRIDAYERKLELIRKLEEYNSFVTIKPALASYFDTEMIKDNIGVIATKDHTISRIAAQTKDLEEAKKSLSVLRQNPGKLNTSEANMLVYLAECDSCEFSRTIDGQPARTDPAAGKMYLFTNVRKNKLFIIPAAQCLSIKNALSTDNAASEVFEEFHHYDVDERDYKIILPEQNPQPLGSAVRIYYHSDKLMELGDSKGQKHGYVHEFDKDQRKATLYKDDQDHYAIVIDNIAIDGRGILN